MGWVAAVAGTLIAAMFAYNWFNKDSSIAQSAEKKSTMNAKTDGTSAGMSETDEISVLSPVQTPAIIEQPAQIRIPSDGSKQGNGIVRRPPAPPLSQLMPPPPPPTVMAPPAAPAPRSRSPPRLKPPTIGRPPTSPTPPRPSGSSPLSPPPSSASSLRIPPTKVLSNASMAPTSSTLPPQSKPSRKVILEPGHSPLDWAALTTNPQNTGLLRGKDAPDRLVKVTPSQLKMQNGRKGRDAWTVFQGKVYNVTPYVPFHPGGKGEILRGAGKDSAQLFLEVHPWVNWDGMLGECCVGILVSEGEGDRGLQNGGRDDNTLDEMD